MAASRGSKSEGPKRGPSRRAAAGPTPRGPIILNDAADRRREFGGPAPDGPLPGRLLVLLSRLHRAEAVRRADPADGARATAPTASPLPRTAPLLRSSP